jgi:xylulokinase
VIIAHDLGTTGNKASLHEDDGRLVAAVTVGYQTRYAAGGVAEQDPHEWWRAICAATHQLLSTTNTRAERVAAVGFSGQMMGAVFLDSHLEPVRPAVIWADHRSGAQAARIAQSVSIEEAYRITGHQLSPTYSLTKIAWVRENEPEAYARTRIVCQAKDYLVARLTGHVVTDPSDASSTNAYDQASGRWSDVMLGAADLPIGLLPEIVPSSTVVGAVRADVADHIGLRPGTAVVLGGGDGPLAAIGAGVIAPEDGAYLYLGSSSWVSYSADAPLHDPQMRTMTFTHVVPGQFVPTATMVAGAGSLQWASEVLAPLAAEATIDTLLAEARDSAALDDHLYFLPHLLGERSPHWNPAARGAFIGLTRAHHRGHLVRAVLEGVALNLLTCVEAFRSCGSQISEVRAIGGGAKSDLWLQLFADAFGVPVVRRDIIDEANSLGAAVVTGVGARLIDDFAVARTLSTQTARFAPNPGRTESFARAHDHWLAAYNAIEPTFRQRPQ